MVDVTTWHPDNVNRLVEQLLAEIEALKAERDTYRDAWRAEVAKNGTQPIDRK